LEDSKVTTDADRIAQDRLEVLYSRWYEMESKFTALQGETPDR
jgi:hypothetical protein